jgi:hypothetical protein
VIVKRIVVFAVTAAFTALALIELRVRESAPDSVPATQFSALRAIETVRDLARAPHPVGTPEHERVRDAIVRRLKALGLQPEVHAAVAANEAFASRWSAPTPMGRVENVVARLPGTAGGAAIVLMAHYDSAPHSPGAADDASGVAIVLETAAALLAGGPRRHDVILLLTDAEEVGLLGAHAFVEQHTWARSGVRAVINLEARGHEGPSLLSEATPGSGWLIRELADGASPPLIDSLFFEVGKVLPNETDLTVWRRRGHAGVNLAFIGGLTHYHNSLDRPEHLSLGSLQEQGDATLALARRLVAGNGAATAEDVVAFQIFGRNTILYSVTAARFLGFLAAISLFGAVAFGLWRGYLESRRLLAGLAATLGVSIAVAIGTTILWFAVTLAQPAYRTTLMGDVHASGMVAIGLIACAVGLFGQLWISAARRLGEANLWAGALIVWLLLLIGAMAAAPGASHVPTWTLLGATPGLVLLMTRSPRTWLGAPLGAMPAVVLVAPLIAVLFTAVSVSMSAVPVLLLGLLLAALTPVMSAVSGSSGRRLYAGVSIVGALVLAIAALQARFDAEHPRPDDVFYIQDLDTQSAHWGSTDARVDAWTRSFLTDTPGAGQLPEHLPTAPENAPVLPGSMLLAPAPQLDLPAPEVAIEHDEIRDGVRRVRLRVRSRRHAPLITLFARSGPAITVAVVDGQPVRGDFDGRRWSLRYWSAPPEGIPVELTLAAPGRLELRVTDESYGLPDAGVSTARPPDTMAVPFMGFIPEATIVAHTVEI